MVLNDKTGLGASCVKGHAKVLALLQSRPPNHRTNYKDTEGVKDKKPVQRREWPGDMVGLHDGSDGYDKGEQLCDANDEPGYVDHTSSDGQDARGNGLTGHLSVGDDKVSEVVIW